MYLETDCLSIFINQLKCLNVVHSIKINVLYYLVNKLTKLINFRLYGSKVCMFLDLFTYI